MPPLVDTYASPSPRLIIVNHHIREHDTKPFVEYEIRSFSNKRCYRRFRSFQQLHKRCMSWEKDLCDELYFPQPMVLDGVGSWFTKSKQFDADFLAQRRVGLQRFLDQVVRLATRYEDLLVKLDDWLDDGQHDQEEVERFAADQSESKVISFTSEVSSVGTNASTMTAESASEASESFKKRVEGDLVEFELIKWKSKAHDLEIANEDLSLKIMELENLAKILQVNQELKMRISMKNAEIASLKHQLHTQTNTLHDLREHTNAVDAVVEQDRDVKAKIAARMDAVMEENRRLKVECERLRELAGLSPLNASSTFSSLGWNQSVVQEAEV